jgi:hypothetical protein
MMLFINFELGLLEYSDVWEEIMLLSAFFILTANKFQFRPLGRPEDRSHSL